jgi:C-terminal processing protease CtpA/Prc
VAALLFGATLPVSSQTLSRYERQRAEEMLDVVKTDIQKNYYDPKFRSVDLESVFKNAQEMIKKAESNGQVFGIIASVLIGFNDSHLFFIPPSRNVRVEYGWQMQMIGDECYVVAVEPGSDAQAKGLKEGDRVWLVEEMKPTRADTWKIQYLLNALRPRPSLHVVVSSPNGPQRQLEINARLREGKRITDLTDYNDFMKLLLEEERDARLRRHRYLETDGDVFIWKMPQFDLSKESVDQMVGKFKNRKAVIIDLRGNGGGYEETLLRLIGSFLPADTKIGDLTRRKESKPMIAKTSGPNPVKGQLVVLIDSESGSSSELFARVMQLEKRGTVIGDRSAGAVMRARQNSHQSGVETVAFYAVSVTDADILMVDGKSLEGTGVTPDELLLPSASDLASQRDPVLARALALVGVTMTPEKAGALFPTEWRR